MNKKTEQSKELDDLVSEFMSNGGEIETIPEGVTGDSYRLTGASRNKKFQLYNLSSEENRSRSGFRSHRIILSPTKNDGT